MNLLFLGNPINQSKKIALLFPYLILGCADIKKESSDKHIDSLKDGQTNLKYTKGFDFPVGKPDAKGYHNAQKFTENNHLGDDWNGNKYGNTDLGDPIYSIANGYVVFSENIGGGWGNVIRIVHFIDDAKQVESVYAHCQERLVKVGDYCDKGKLIGTIGNNDGAYYAHLHLEIRDRVGMPIGSGYSINTDGYLDPTKFIQENRKRH